MRLVIFAGGADRPIGGRIGTPEYSYHFVIEAFLPVLARLAPCTRVADLDAVEPIRAWCEARGESCVVLSFVPPHKTTLFMRVPLVPVFAWEFENIPFETWDGQPKHDWRMVLQQSGRAITLSTHSARVVRDTMGAGFPAVGIPPPVYDRMAGLRARIGGRPPRPVTLRFAGTLIDSRAWPISPEMPIPPPGVFPGTAHDPASDAAVSPEPVPVPVPVSVPAFETQDHGRALATLAMPPGALEPEPQPRGLPGKVIGFYREKIRPAAPLPVARAASLLGRAAWYASLPLRPLPVETRPDLGTRAAVLRTHGAAIYREAVRDALPRGARAILGHGGTIGLRGLRALRARAEADMDAAPAPLSLEPHAAAPALGRAGRAGPVFHMPPPADQVPMPLPLAEPFVAADTAPRPARRAAAGDAVSANEVTLDGVVFLAVLNPSDGRKNWPEIMSGFAWALGAHVDATLVLKLACPTVEEFWKPVLTEICKQPAFRGRIVVIHGYLDDAQMGTLLEGAAYVVNVASCEGCALPLLEGMSVGRPAIAPDHTAMADYVTPANAFVVQTHLEPSSFPQDSRALSRTMWHCPRWDSLLDCFREAYAVATGDPARWLAMADSAMAAQRSFCGDAPVERKLRDILGLQPGLPSLAGWGRDLGDVPLASAAFPELVAP